MEVDERFCGLGVLAFDELHWFGSVANDAFVWVKFRGKNRYSDILAYKHTRVHLLPREGDESGNEEDPEVAGYINANFIDGPLGELSNRKIIGCQGPKENTSSDLWRMISQENVTLIVTTCNTVEKGSKKCFRFWPNDSGQFEFSEETDLNDTLR